MKKTASIILFFSCALLIQGCNAYKNVPYFQDVPDSSRVSVQTAKYKTLTIEKGDMLSVNVQTIDPEANAIFNQMPTSTISQMAGMNGGLSAMATNGGGGGAAASAMGAASISASAPASSGYLVTDAGTIELPLIGKITVAGLSTSAAGDTIERRVALLYKQPIVTVRFSNLKVSVLGEVLKPGAYTLTNEKNTIFDVLAMAGDLTIFGKRNNIILIRDSAGKTNFIRFSLNSKDLVKQDYFYLKQNDVLYVEPDKEKAASLDASQARNYAIAASILSIIIVIATRVN